VYSYLIDDKNRFRTGGHEIDLKHIQTAIVNINKSLQESEIQIDTISLRLANLSEWVSEAFIKFWGVSNEYFDDFENDLTTRFSVYEFETLKSLLEWCRENRLYRVCIFDSFTFRLNKLEELVLNAKDSIPELYDFRRKLVDLRTWLTNEFDIDKRNISIALKIEYNRLIDIIIPVVNEHLTR